MSSSSRGAQLAALARQAQWLLDQAAFDLPAGRCSPADQAALAGVLAALAAALRDDDQTPLVIDADAVPADVAGAVLAASRAPLGVVGHA